MKKSKKLDNSGFVIVETIIVAVFVIGICTFLFMNLLPLIGEYEKVSYYDDLSSKYKTHEIRKMLLREIDKSSLGNVQIKESILNNGNYVLYKSVREEDNFHNPLCDKLTNKKYCNTLLSDRFLYVDQIIITPFKLSDFKRESKDDKNISRQVREYIDYLPSYSKYSSTYDNYLRMIVVFHDGHIANIEVNADEI